MLKMKRRELLTEDQSLPGSIFSQHQSYRKHDEKNVKDSVASAEIRKQRTSSHCASVEKKKIKYWTYFFSLHLANSTGYSRSDSFGDTDKGKRSACVIV